MTARFNSLIIGAGNIGAFFDTPGSDRILTHAHAFSRHKGFRIAGFVDVDVKKAQRAAELWGGGAFSTIDSAFSRQDMDIVSIAVPDEHHVDALRKLADMPVKLIFCEKPLAKTMKEADEVLALYREKKPPVLVNYTRRFVPEFIRLQEDIRQNRYGEYLSGSGYYGKGILHNGSHLVDLLRYLIGEITAARQVNRFNDFYSDDPSVAAVLTFVGGKPFHLQCIDCGLYTIFELDLLFERKRIRIKDSGFAIEEYDVLDDKIFQGYRNITRVRETGTSLGKAAYFAAENIYDYLTGSVALRSPLDDAYETMKTSVMIRDHNG